MTDLELLGKGEEALALAVDGTETKLLDVHLTGEGDLVKTGSGTLHLTNEANWSGMADVREGTLAVSVGALGVEGVAHPALRVAEGAAFSLSGAVEDDRIQYVKSLDAAGTVTIGTSASPSPNALVLALEEGGSLSETAELHGTSNAVLALANGSTLTATDLEETAADYKGVIYLTEGTTLALSGKDASKYVDLSNVKGTGTIALSDYALFDTTGQFAGTTRVLEGGDLLIAPGSLMNSRAVLEVQGGKVTSQRNPTFASVTLGNNAWLDLGSALAGDDYASGSILSAGNLTLGDVTLKVAAGLDTEGVYASGILSLDNLEGKTTWLLTGRNVTVNGNVRIEGVSDGVSPSAKLIQDGKEIGTVTASLEANIDRNRGVGFTTRASSMELSDVLVLNGSYTPDADSTLDLQVRNAEGTENGGLRVASLGVTLAGDGSNRYGTLEVDENAVARIAADQTLTRGGEINGRLRSVTWASGTAPALNVTGGTLTIGESASGDVAIRLNASNEAEGAKLLFSNRTTDETAYLYAGDVFGEKGARVTFDKTAGNFRLAGGSAAYALTGESSVTFGPLANASALSGTYAVGEGSSAYFDFTGAAGEIDLSGVTGAGTVSLNYGTAAGTLLDVTAMNADFKGTLAFTNATAAIGTDASVANSALTAFATQKGSLVAGEGSTLVINNEKVRGADGSFDPKPVKLAGDLTISDRATLDFTAGIRSDHNDEHLGNGSGFSVNTLDMNGHGLVIANSDDANHLTVRASLEKVDVGTGFPSNGEYHGSILDMLGNRSTPILTLVTGIDATDEALAAIASDMVLEGESENATHEIKFWQPDWNPNDANAGETVHVANVTTGLRLVASKGDDGLGNIAVGAGITGIEVLADKILRMDESVAAETLSSHIVDAAITGAGSVLVSNSLTAPGTKGITFAAENSYTGETAVDLGATLTAAHAGAFAGSERVSVGTATEDGTGHAPQPSTLKVNVAQAETDAYANTLRMKALTVGKNGTVELADGNSLLLTEAGAVSTLAEGSTLTGGTTTAIGLAAGPRVVMGHTAGKFALQNQLSPAKSHERQHQDVPNPA